jgi:hypothetical protein
MRRNGKRGNDESKESSTNEVFAERINMAAMQEYEIYLPTTLDDGTPVKAAKIQGNQRHTGQSLRRLYALEPSVGRRVAHGRHDFS